MRLGASLGLSSPLNTEKLSGLPATMSGWLDATAYGGTGQTLSSLIARPHDGTSLANNSAIFGSTSASAADDPVFSGPVSAPQSFFTLEGGDYFTLPASSLTSTSGLLKAHRSDQNGFFLVWAGQVSDASTVEGLCGNSSAFNQPGFLLRKTGTKTLQLMISNGTSIVTATGPVLPANVPLMIIVSWDGTASTNNVRFWINTSEKTVASLALGNSTANSTRDVHICANNGGTSLGIGSKFRTFAWGAEFIDDTKAGRIFDFFRARHGFDYAGRLPFHASTRQAAVFGDSISYYNLYGVDGASSLSSNSVGAFTVYAALSGQRMRLSAANNYGVTGNTTTQMLSRLPQLSGKNFDVCFLMGGTNNATQKISASVTISDLSTIISTLAGTMRRIVILQTILPRSAWGTLTAPEIVTARQDILTVNAWIRNQDSTYDGRVIVVDTYAALEDGSNTFTPLANTLSDGIHPNPHGAIRMGKALYNRLLSSYDVSAPPDFSVGNLLANGTMTGTAGSVAGMTGSVADGFTATLSGGTGGTGTAVASKPSGGVQQLQLNWGTGSSVATDVKISQTITSGFNVGETVYAAALIEITGPTPVNIFRNVLTLTLSGSGLSGVTSTGGMRPVGSATDLIGETYLSAGEYLIQTPDMTIASGSGLALAWEHKLSGNTAGGLAASGTVRIKGAGVFKR